MQDFKNKIVVITGAASGMGRAYALAFANLGSRLALCDFDKGGLKEAAALIKDKYSQESLIDVFDISNRAASADFARKVEEKLGPAQVLINNAGIEGSAKPVWATDESQFRKVMEVNYFGLVNGTCAFLPQMQAQNAGVIVNVSSIFGLIGTPNHADYCGTKFAVRGFTESLMAELEDTAIQVHLLHPGGIATNIARQSHSQDFARHYFKTTPEQIAQALIRGIQKNQARIVFGHGSSKAWLGAKLLPLKLLSKICWHELKKVIDLKDYPSKSKSLSSQEPLIKGK